MTQAREIVTVHYTVDLYLTIASWLVGYGEAGGVPLPPETSVEGLADHLRLHLQELEPAYHDRLMRAAEATIQYVSDTLIEQHAAINAPVVGNA